MFRGVCLWSGDGLDGAGLGFVSAGEAVVGVDLVSFDAEREMLRVRTRIGLDAARKNVRTGGRRPKLKPEQRRESIHLVNSGEKIATEPAPLFDVHSSAVSRLLRSQPYS